MGLLRTAEGYRRVDKREIQISGTFLKCPF
jgi:hypothetical protein